MRLDGKRAYTSEERRAIAARIDKHAWGNGDYAGSALISLAECLGVDDEDIRGRSYGYIARMVAHRVRELCEPSAHDSMCLPVGADGVTVMPGQDVYGEDGRCWHVIGVGGGTYPIIAVPHGARTSRGEYKRLKPRWLRHRRDTPPTLADEIDRWVVSSGQDEPLDELRAIARRLRALGGGE